MHTPVDRALIVATASRAVTMERWSCDHRAFIVESSFKNSDSATQTQHEFMKHFNIGRNGKVSTRQTILNWASQFRSTAFAMPKYTPRRPRSLRNPENVEGVRVHDAPLDDIL
jgi:hypothetical protein